MGLVSCVWVEHVYHMKHLPCYLNLGEADKARSFDAPKCHILCCADCRSTLGGLHQVIKHREKFSLVYLRAPYVCEQRPSKRGRILCLEFRRERVPKPKIPFTLTASQSTNVLGL